MMVPITKTNMKTKKITKTKLFNNLGKWIKELDITDNEYEIITGDLKNYFSEKNKKWQIFLQELTAINEFEKELQHLENYSYKFNSQTKEKHKIWKTQLKDSKQKLQRKFEYYFRDCCHNILITINRDWIFTEYLDTRKWTMNDWIKIIEITKNNITKIYKE